MIRIDVLPDDVLLEIFDFYGDMSPSYEGKTGSVCRPALSDLVSQSAPGRWRFPPLGDLQERCYLSLINIAFRCMTLTCDALAALSSETKQLKVDHEYMSRRTAR